MARVDPIKPAIIYNIVNLLNYTLLIIAAIVNVFEGKSFASVIANIYVIIFAVCFFSFEVHKPVFAQEYLKFLQIYRGKGIAFIL